MRIERINENKIKVVVNRDDVRIWNVNLKNFTDNTPEAQDMFWYALKQAEQDVSFSVGQAQLLVETMAAANDGFIMIISKLRNEAEVADAILKSGRRIRQAEFKLHKRPKAASLLRLFRFESFDDLCRGIAEINELYIGESKVYKYEDGFYLEIKPVDSFGLFEIENILSEFSERIKRPVIMQGVLNEHAKVMVENDAVAVLFKNFC